MNNNADVELLFGVKGGSSLSKDSGLLIKETLEQMVKNLEDKKIPKVKLFFTYAKGDLDEMIKELGRDLKEKLKNGLIIRTKLELDEVTQIRNEKDLAKTDKALKKKQEAEEYNKVTEAINKAIEAKRTFYNEHNDTSFKSGQVGTTHNIEEFNKEIEQLKLIKSSLKENTELTDAMRSSLSQSIDKKIEMERGSEFKGIKDEITSVEKEFKNLYKQKIINVDQIQNVNDKFEALRNIIKDTSLTGKQKNQLNNTITEIEGQNSILKDQTLIKIQDKYSKIIAKAEDWLKRTKDSVANTEENTNELNKLQEALNKIPSLGELLFDKNGNELKPDQQIENVTKSVRELETTLLTTQSNIAKIGNTQLTVTQKLQKALTNKLYTGISAMVIGLAGNALRQVYNNVKAIDRAITDLKIVTKPTGEALSSFLKQATRDAKELGIEINNLIKSTTTYARLGFSMEDSGVFAKLTAMYSTVTGVYVDEATTNLTALIKAYNISAQDAEAVLDKMIYVGKDYAQQYRNILKESSYIG